MKMAEDQTGESRVNGNEVKPQVGYELPEQGQEERFQYEDD